MTGSEMPKSGERTASARLRSILAYVFDIPADDIRPETYLSDLPRWSSLSFVVMMTAVEHEFDMQPDRERAWGAATVGDLLAIIAEGAAPPAHDG